MELKKTFLVTGANQGIGKALVYLLAKNHPKSKVILTARKLDLGMAALKELNSEGFTNVEFHQLDVTNSKSISGLVQFLKDSNFNLDVLVNNAGWASHGSELNESIARKTIETNYYGPKNLTISLLPFLNNNGRVVNVSSVLGVITENYSKELRKKFLSDDISMKELDDLMENFVESVKDGSNNKKGWPSNSYGVSKAGLICLTRIFARDYGKDERNIRFYSCHPGYVSTNMSSYRGNKTPLEGAQNPYWLATSNDIHEGNGIYFSDVGIVGKISY